MLWMLKVANEHGKIFAVAVVRAGSYPDAKAMVFDLPEIEDLRDQIDFSKVICIEIPCEGERGPILVTTPEAIL